MPANRKSPAAAAASSSPEEGAVSFEQALERLETIVSELEAGSLSLEDSIARYEEGVRLSRRLTETLDQAEKRIERLEQVAGKTPVARPLENDLGQNEHAAEGGEGELPF